MQNQEEQQTRPSWEEYFKEMVQVTAKRSTCKRLHVGCLLVRENRIISQGYNGYLPGCPHEQKMRDGHEIGTVHAEQKRCYGLCQKRCQFKRLHCLYNTLSLYELYESFMCCRNKRNFLY